MKTLYVLRHGQTQWNVEGRMQGRLDSPLTDEGRDQVQRHGQFLGGQPVSRVILSPLGRAIESANLLNSHLQVPMQQDDRLAERDCGSWGGLLVADIEKHFPRAWQDRLSEPYLHRPPGGENHQDLLDRTSPLLESLFELAGEHVVLMSHAIVSRVVLMYFLGLLPEQAMAVRHPNEIFYRLTFSADSVTVDHIVDGEFVVPGLRRATPSAPSRAPTPGHA